MNSEKGTRLSQRHDPARLDELKTISDESDIPQVSLVAACIRALFKTWKEEGQLVIPFRVVSETEWLQYKAEQNDIPQIRTVSKYSPVQSETALVNESPDSEG